ncbi:hypothetical protein K438DRAFT_2151367 [Mycena galopus ATCC 62051]|nr:hypothetical protein K438DRAFT_2151367 [Mycena galopus ATCC 62051]
MSDDQLLDIGRRSKWVHAGPSFPRDQQAWEQIIPERTLKASDTRDFIKRKITIIKYKCTFYAVWSSLGSFFGAVFAAGPLADRGSAGGIKDAGWTLSTAWVLTLSTESMALSVRKMFAKALK